MASNRLRKAALLLTTLDSASAAELLKAVSPQLATEIVAELAYVSQSGLHRQKGALAEPAREFFGMINVSKGPQQGDQFLREVLESAMGKAKGEELLGRLDELIETRDPFRIIREAAIEDVAGALTGESGQVAALVISELPAKKSSELLPLLQDDVRAAAVASLTAGSAVSPDARQKVAAVIRNRLKKSTVDEDGVPAPAAAKAKPEQRDQHYRKVSLLLRRLATPLRDSLLGYIEKQDKEAGQAVRRLMVVWEDIPLIGDKILQQMLRTVDARKLATALVQADESIKKKLRANMSERAAAMLDEESSLLNKPKPEDISAAREIILKPLRDLSAKGELPMEEA